MKNTKLAAAFALPVAFCLVSGIVSLEPSNAADQAFGAQGSSSSGQFDTVYEDWTDPKRGRTIPVKLYLPKGASGPLPVLIFSHGLGGSRDAANYLGSYMAEHGYVGVFLQHPGSDSSVWRSSGAVGINAIRAKLAPAANADNAFARMYDVKFAIDELERRNQSGNLAGRLDLSKIAMSGHSFGAGTTMALAGQNYMIGNSARNFSDPRIKAAIYLSAPVNLRGNSPEQVFGGIKIPGLLMTGTEDNSPIGDTKAADRVVPFDGFRAPNQYLVVFNGGDHAVFGGRDRSPQDQKFHEEIEKLCLEFLNAYLKNDPQAEKWLKTDAVAYLGKTAQFKSK